MSIDLNADAGESFGPWGMGRDDLLFPYLTSANLACGFHAGDPQTMKRSVELAQKTSVTVGAHPGFFDHLGFGRREIAMKPEEIESDIIYQIGALSAFLKVQGMTLHHVKPHGALYNQATHDTAFAEAIARAVYNYDPALPLVLLPGTAMEEAAVMIGTRFVREAFPDRAYLDDGRLAPRHMPGAVISNSTIVAQRAVRMCTEGRVKTLQGQDIKINAETLCLHGDNPAALENAQAVREALTLENINVRAY